MADPKTHSGLFGLMAEFGTAQELLDAVLTTKAEGYRAIDAFTPYPVEAISEEIEDHKKSKVSLIVLCGGLTGLGLAFALQTYTAVFDYPLNIGGRPPFSWPAFVPVTFELTILLAAFSAVIGMLALNKLPQPYHPVFNVPAFERALQDRYFLLVESHDPRFDVVATRAFLESLGPLEVHDVEP